jgi:single-strand binding protein
MNKVILMGHLTRDPEVRYTQSDKPLAIARYTLAVNKAYKKEGEPDADFIPCVAYGKNGEFAEKYLNKGRQIAVVGRLQVRMWEDDKGDKRKTTEVVIENQYFADSRNKSEEKTLSEAVNSHLYPIDDNVEDEDLPF